MTKNRKSNQLGQDGRSDRLAEALRANLRRRKDQLRGRAQAADKPMPAPAAQKSSLKPDKTEP